MLNDLLHAEDLVMMSQIIEGLKSKFRELNAFHSWGMKAKFEKANVIFN